MSCSRDGSRRRRNFSVARNTNFPSPLFMSAIAMIRRKLRGAYLSQAGRLWKSLPASLRLSTAGLVYARQLDRLTRLHADRKQYFATFFLRNRPELELLGRLAQN